MHGDNAPAHNTLSVKQFLANKNITLLEHPPYSPDLAPCNFYLVPKIKSMLKGTHFVSVENVKAKTAEILNSLTEHDLWNCFEHWQHCMQLCVNSEGNYCILKAILVDFLNLLNRVTGTVSCFLFFFCVGPHIFYTHLMAKFTNTYSAKWQCSMGFLLVIEFPKFSSLLSHFSLDLLFLLT